MKEILKGKKQNKQIILKILMLTIPVSMKDKSREQKPFLSQLYTVAQYSVSQREVKYKIVSLISTSYKIFYVQIILPFQWQ